MVEFCSLFSSSRGNCELIGNNSTKLLIDAGVSCKKIVQALAEVGRDASLIKGVLITHEHSDHMKGVSVLCRKYGIPVYANEKTIEKMEFSKKEEIAFIPFESDKPFAIDDIEIMPFSTPHDAVSSVGFRFSFDKEGKAIGFATDIGYVSEAVHNNLMGCDLVFLESNHDRNMLLSGGYPYFLKQRILSDHGHLCNDDCSVFAKELIKGGTKHLILGHLSMENNMPQIAYMTSKQTMEKHGMLVDEDYTLDVARSNLHGMLVTL